MKSFLGLILLLICNITLADSLDIKVNPTQPVIDDSFEVEFIIESSQGDNPEISFVPVGAEVVSKNQGAVSTRTSYINGKMSFSRTISVKYELQPKRAGTIFLQNIQVQIDGKTLTHRSVPIQVLRKAAQSPQIFVRAEVAKNDVYVGESILVRYYLYNLASTPLSATDVRRFPKLDKFLKRYHQEKVIPERVDIDGKMYVRRIIYTAQLYGEKPGKYVVDPISLSVTYSDRGMSDFDNFGFGLRLGTRKQKAITSKSIDINVIPLPVENMPKSFTGLVGKHEFKLTTPKQKYLSNEPIELQLSISGEGALELVEAPKLFVNDLIEEFETTTDLKINPNFTAEKQFEYTYLGRGNVKLDKFDYPLSYFDPETGQYVTENLNLGPIEIVAIGNVLPPGKIKSQNQGTSETQINNDKVSTSAQIDYQKAVFNPIYKSINTYIYYSKHLFYLVGISLVMLLSFFTFKQAMRLKKKDKTIFEQIYTSGVTYGSLFRVLHMLGDEDSMHENIEKSQLSDECKTYFYDLIETVNSRFDKGAKEAKFKIKKKYFQEVEAFLSKDKHENFE